MRFVNNKHIFYIINPIKNSQIKLELFPKQGYKDINCFDIF
jgi:hypothetical protein